MTNLESSRLEKATLGGGCFWCTEAMYKALEGVIRVEAGYAGGKIKNPTYKEVCSGLTGHSEVIQITFDPDIISYVDIISAFWAAHDPTTLNRQGNDVGTQYRSIILFENDEQRKIAQASLKVTEESGLFSGRFTTEIGPLTVFYPAESHHQDYFENNPNQPYCMIVTKPKLDKFRNSVSALLK